MKFATSIFFGIFLVLPLGFGTAMGQVGLPEPAPRVLAFMPAGASGGSFLGVGVAGIGADRAAELKLPEARGIEITRVEEGSPAAAAGLQTGDVLLEYNGQRITGIEGFIGMVRATPAGRHVKLSISRGGEARTLTAVLGYRKPQEIRIEALPQLAPLASPTAVPNFDGPVIGGAVRQSVLGVEVESLTAQLAGYFGVKNGVLVRAVGKDTPAERAGFRAGDIITKVDGTRIEHPSDVFVAVHAPRSNRSISVSVTRDHRELGLSATISSDDAADDDPGAPR
ncbi:MAG TPA: PDZ domain-containing protein [Bryobacteraceae bacterium]|jgi:serine protease Do|nr:PDZ domain-containing protein [Bryobacteraceae bacterium]